MPFIGEEYRHPAELDGEFSASDELALMNAGLRCCDVHQCPRPAVAVETDTDGATIFVCEDHQD